VTPTLPPPRIGPSEPQARAEAAFRLQQREQRAQERRAEGQFATEHAISDARRRQPQPRDLRSLVRWFKREWQMQLPEDVHAGWATVEVDRPGYIVRGMDELHPDEHACPTWPADCLCRPRDEKGEHIWDPGGGTRAGTPRLAGSFRAYLWGNPMARDDHGDGDPINPLRYRLAQMATGDLTHRAAGLFLFRLACHDFRVEATGLAMDPPLIAPYLDPYATWCLMELDERMRSLYFHPISVPRAWRP